MAANFVNQIGSALYDYAIGAGINISPSYANDIAWGGLAQAKDLQLMLMVIWLLVVWIRNGSKQLYLMQQ